MNKTILKIEEIISQSIINHNNIGLLSGLSGVALFYDYLYQIYPSDNFKNKLLSITDRINNILSEEFTSSSLCTGLAGFGIVLLRMENDVIEIDEQYFESIDLILLEDIKSESAKKNYDFLHGSMGIAFYFIERYKQQKNTQISEILNDFSEDIINKINNDFKDLLVTPVFENSSCYYLGMAHGITSYLNFLIYLEIHFEDLKFDIRESLTTCISFLKLHKNQNVISKQHYPNLILLGENRVIEPLLAWCQGDLGISNALYNAGIYLNNENLVSESVEMLANIKNITIEESGIKDYAMCHGSIGVMMQYYLASKKSNLDYSAEISNWHDILKKQTNDFNTFLSFNSGNYFEEISLLDGLVGLGLGILTLENKIDIEWLEIFNLH